MASQDNGGERGGGKVRPVTRITKPSVHDKRGRWVQTPALGQAEKNPPASTCLLPSWIRTSRRAFWQEPAALVLRDRPVYPEAKRIWAA